MEPGWTERVGVEEVQSPAPLSVVDEVEAPVPASTLSQSSTPLIDIDPKEVALRHAIREFLTKTNSEALPDLDQLGAIIKFQKENNARPFPDLEKDFSVDLIKARRGINAVTDEIDEQVAALEREIRQDEKKAEKGLSFIELGKEKGGLVPRLINEDLFFRPGLWEEGEVGDRAADALIQTVLAGYGFSSTGYDLSEKRDLSYATFTHPAVPKEVRALVKFQSLSTDYDLDVEDAVPTLKKAKRAIEEMLKVEDFLQAHDVTVRGDGIAKRVENLLQDLSTPSDGAKIEVPSPIMGLKDILEQYRARQNALSELQEYRQMYEDAHSVLAPQLEEAALRIRTQRREESRRIAAAAKERRYKEILHDPIEEILAGAKDEISKAYGAAGDSDRSATIGSFTSHFQTFRWYQFWRRGEKILIRDAALECLIVESEELNPKDNPSEEKISAYLARILKSSPIFRHKEKEELLGHVLKLSISQELFRHVEIQLFGAEARPKYKSHQTLAAIEAIGIRELQYDLRQFSDGAEELRESTTLPNVEVTDLDTERQLFH